MCPLLTLAHFWLCSFKVSSRSRGWAHVLPAAWHYPGSLRRAKPRPGPSQHQPALAPRAWPGPDAGSTEAVLFSSLFAFSTAPGMCLPMVEKMQGAARGGRERRPPWQRWVPEPGHGQGHHQPRGQGSPCCLQGWAEFLGCFVPEFKKADVSSARSPWTQARSEACFGPQAGWQGTQSGVQTFEPIFSSPFR